MIFRPGPRAWKTASALPGFRLSLGLTVEVEGKRLELVREGDEPRSQSLAQARPGATVYLEPRLYHVLPSSARADLQRHPV